MLLTTQKGIVRVEHNTGDVGGPMGTAVTTGGSVSTKGTVAELIAATAFDAYLITVLVTGYGGSATSADSVVDILVGSSTEQVLIPNLFVGWAHGSTTPSAREYTFPLYIPAGTRIAAAAAGRRTSTAMSVAVFLHGGDGLPPFRVGTKVTTYGMGTVPLGTTITLGANTTEGGWTQITSSTTEDHFAFIPGFQAANDSTIGGGAPGELIQVDIGIGASTEEQIGSWWILEGNDERVSGPHPSLPVFRDVPAGTRLSLRASPQVTSASGTHTGVIYAVS